MTKEEQFILYFNNMQPWMKAEILGLEYDEEDEDSEIDIVITKIIPDYGPVVQSAEPFYPDNDYPLI